MVLKDKYLKEGWVKFDFLKANQNSQISFLFYYVDKLNFYEFLIEQNRVIIKEVEKGK